MSIDRPDVKRVNGGSRRVVVGVLDTSEQQLAVGEGVRSPHGVNASDSDTYIYRRGDNKEDVVAGGGEEEVVGFRSAHERESVRSERRRRHGPKQAERTSVAAP